MQMRRRVGSLLRGKHLSVSFDGNMFSTMVGEAGDIHETKVTPLLPRARDEQEDFLLFIPTLCFLLHLLSSTFHEVGMKSFGRAFLTVSVGVASAFAVVPHSIAQTANLVFDDQSGPGDAGSYPAGLSFNLSVSLSFAPGGKVTNLAGLSYWLEQQSPLPPFYFALTDRNATGSQFTFLQSPGLTYPQALAPSNPSDLGGGTQSGAGVGAGTYFIANVAVSIARSAPPGTYILENTTTGSKKSVISDDQGHTSAIGHTSYTLTVVQFNISSIMLMDGQDIVLQCNGVPNALNRIEASPDLSPNSWQTIGSVMADASGTFAFKDTGPASPQYYRISYP